jgi:predicted DNA-binding transcriptional regulator AlpA
MAVEKKLQDQIAYPPRAFRANRAASYLGGMSTSKFLSLVEEGKLPKPVRIDGMTMWDRLELDTAFDSLKQQEANAERNTVAMALGVEE